MSDEVQVRELLARAAELPDSIQPPADRLILQGKRKRVLRAAASTLTIGILAVALAAFALPPLLRHGGPSQPAGRESVPGVTSPGQIAELGSGPTAARLSRFRWSSLASSPLGAISHPLVSWAGKELIELGFQHASGSDRGAAFVPATNRWHPIPAVKANVGFTNAVSVWTGKQLFVASGHVGSCPVTSRNQNVSCLPQVLMYDPASNSWTTSALPRQFWGLTLQSAVWTGGDVVLAAASTHSGKLYVAAYNPATRRWQNITPRLPAGHPPRSVSMVATPGRLILWSLWDVVTTHRNSQGRLTGFSDRAGVDILSLGSGGTWRDVTGDWPQNQTVGTPIYTVRGILIPSAQVWCGTVCSPPGISSRSYFASPATLARTAIPAGPLDQTGPAMVWSGRAVIAVNLYSSISGSDVHIRPDDMAAWDSATGWHRLPAPPGYPKLAAAPVWTGSELLALSADGALQALHR